ncbi:MAG: tRNA pseudouridine(38-40) synthase TruA [Proteobacteria bacterium]|nr:tRNA pseudouridine(38-40) synthase TruA [Pseudomonadota bacterium]
MARYRLTIEYDGTAYVGWQRQDNGPSIQGALERAIHAFCGETVTLQGAGRTDAGVHALGQVAHGDLDRDWPADTVRDAINSHLRPEPIAVLRAERVADGFSARFDAIERSYLYRILNRRSPPTLDVDRAWHVNRPLDADAMHEAAQVLVGHHDFSTFRDAQCQAASPVKSLDAFAVTRQDDLVCFRVRARSFLHRQVRSMVGSLSHVGEGRWKAADLKAALDAADRKACGVVAPACGLYLTAVRYPGEDQSR